MKVAGVLLLIFVCARPSLGQEATANMMQQNIVAVTPFQFTQNGIGLGGSFEHLIGKNATFSWYIPIAATFDVANTNRIYDYNTGNYSTGKTNALFYAMPGIKFYPSGSNGKIKYALGVSAMIADGKSSNGELNHNGLNVTEQVQPHFIAGGLLQNSINIRAGKSLYLGVEIGVGESFINQLGNTNKDNEFLIQGALKAGYRF